MGNKRSRRSRRLATPSPERETSETRVDSPETGNITLTNSNLNVQESLGELNSENQLREPSQISDEIQVWTQIVERKNTERIEKMREEMDSKLEAILKERKCIKSASVTTNPRSDANEIQEPRPSESRSDPSIGVRASDYGNSDSENDDYPLRASKMKDLKHPAKPLFRSESDVDTTVVREGGFTAIFRSQIIICNFSIPNHRVYFFDPKPPSVFFRSQTEIRLSQKGQRSFCLNCQFLYILSLRCQISFTIRQKWLFRLRIDSTREPKECNEILRIISAKELYTCRNLQLYDHVY